MDMPSDWDDAAYCAHNRDVALAIERGEMPNGWYHYDAYGRKEGRGGRWFPPDGARMTRECSDPWNYLEISNSHGLKPCCNYPAIAQWKPEGPSIEELRNSQPFRDLRASLITGHLSATCRNCHIRAQVAVEPETEQPGAGKSSNEARLDAAPLRHLRIEITSRCNLRCVYCAVSQPSYAGADMSAQVFDDVLATVANLPRDTHIMVNGHGESTFHPQWMTLCDGLTQRGFRPSIITNLARRLDDAEARCLARFIVVQISLDTVDAEQLAQIRRRVRLSTIVENIDQIRQAARALGVQPPRFALSCGVFDLNFAGLEQVADFAIEKAVASVTFWELVKYPDVPGASNVNSVASLDPEEIAKAVRCLDNTLAKLQEAGITTEVAGDFLDRWRRVGLGVSGRPAGLLPT